MMWSSAEIDRMFVELSKRQPSATFIGPDVFAALGAEARGEDPLEAAEARRKGRERARERSSEFLRSWHQQQEKAKGSTAPLSRYVEPYVWRDPKTIPRRAWLYGRHLIRKFISTTIAPGAVGKTSLTLVEAVAMASGRPLLGIEIQEPLRVWVWNGEDPLEELERRIAAILLHYKLDESDLGGRLFVKSGRDAPIKIVAQEKTGTKVAQPLKDALIKELRDNAIDAFTIDPFVSSHSVSENDNMAIEAVVSAFAEIADAANASGDLVHHVRKGQSGQGEHTVEDARGAISLIAKARSARVLNRMSEDEADKAGSVNRFSLFRVTNGKENLAPMTGDSDWYHLRSVPLGNGDPGVLNDAGDWIQVVETWTWPDLLAEVTVQHLRDAQAAVAAGRWRENHQAKDWVGIPIAKVLGLDPKQNRKKIIAILKTWMGNGMFVIVKGQDEKRNERSFVEVGEPAAD